MAETVTIQPVKGKDNVFKVTMTITKGKIHALRNALDDYNSPVAQDLLHLIESANPPD